MISRRTATSDGGDNAALLVGLIGAAKEGADIEIGLRKRGLTHLMVRTNLLLSYLKNNLTAENSGMWNGFVRGHVQTLYQDESYAVLEIHG